MDLTSTSHKHKLPFDLDELDVLEDLQGMGVWVYGLERREAQHSRDHSLDIDLALSCGQTTVTLEDEDFRPMFIVNLSTMTQLDVQSNVTMRLWNDNGDSEEPQAFSKRRKVAVEGKTYKQSNVDLHFAFLGDPRASQAAEAEAETMTTQMEKKHSQCRVAMMPCDACIAFEDNVISHHARLCTGTLRNGKPCTLMGCAWGRVKMGMVAHDIQNVVDKLWTSGTLVVKMVDFTPNTKVLARACLPYEVVRSQKVFMTSGHDWFERTSTCQLMFAALDEHTPPELMIHPSGGVSVTATLGSVLGLYSADKTYGVVTGEFQVAIVIVNLGDPCLRVNVRDNNPHAGIAAHPRAIVSLSLVDAKSRHFTLAVRHERQAVLVGLLTLRIKE